MKATVEAEVKRGEKSWSYIYTFLGFTLAIEGVFISLIPNFWLSFIPFQAGNISLFVILSGLTVYLFLYSGKFHNKLMGWKNKYEEKSRKI